MKRLKWGMKSICGDIHGGGAWGVGCVEALSFGYMKRLKWGVKSICGDIHGGGAWGVGFVEALSFGYMKRLKWGVKSICSGHEEKKKAKTEEGKRKNK